MIGTNEETNDSLLKNMKGCYWMYMPMSTDVYNEIEELSVKTGRSTDDIIKWGIDFQKSIHFKTICRFVEQLHEIEVK